MSDAAPSTPDSRVDVVIAGGGLAAGLIAMALAARRPELSVRIVERAATLGAGHTWSFFSTDLSPAAQALAAPLIVHSWPGYEVRFPAHRRRIANRYNSIDDARFHQVVSAAVAPGTVLAGAEIAAVGPEGVTLADQRVLRGRCVVDARGPVGDPALRSLRLGWQKFVGVEIETVAPHGLAEPIIMDATVPQADGYRFLYALPFSPTRLLIEDTRYADGPALDRVDLAAEGLAYAEAQGWTAARVVREEHGILPIALAGDIDAFWRQAAADGVARAGLRSALFHPTTGYSLPDAAHTALKIAALPEITTATVAEAIRAASTQAWRDRAFFRLLNRMLFRAADPDKRFKVLERFYRLGAPMMERFYAADLTTADKLRILTGKPPVPIGRALACMSERGLLSEPA